MNDKPDRKSFLIPDSGTNLLRLGSLLGIATGLFTLVAGLMAIYLNLSAQLELERANHAASRQAEQIAARLSTIQTSLRDASVVDAARSGEPDALRAALRQRGVQGIIDARLLPAGIDDIALDNDPGLDFAATETLIEAIRRGRADSRVLQPGTSSESLVFAERLPGETGVLWLRLTTSVATSLIEPVEAIDFVALAQRNSGDFALLDVAGRSAAAPIQTLPIRGSSLSLQWSRAVTRSPLATRTAVIVGASGLILLMVGLLLRRRTRLARYLARRGQNQ